MTQWGQVKVRGPPESRFDVRHRRQWGRLKSEVHRDQGPRTESGNSDDIVLWYLTCCLTKECHDLRSSGSSSVDDQTKSPPGVADRVPPWDGRVTHYWSLWFCPPTSASGLLSPLETTPKLWWRITVVTRVSGQRDDYADTGSDRSKEDEWIPAWRV